MSYSIYIGKAVISYSNDDGDAYVSVEAEREINESAPNFGYGDVSGIGNCRKPGYCQMANFCRETGLYSLFYDDENGILRNHPGCVALEERHLKAIVAAKEKWESDHKECKEKLPYKSTQPENYNDMNWEERKAYEEKQGFDWVYARLVWFEFWMNNALKNYEMPVISNY